MKANLLEWIDNNRVLFGSMAKAIWDNPQIGFEETIASQLHRDAAAKAGFRISDVDGIPTAFVAECGSGKPVLGLLGEFDALAQMSQVVSGEPKPVKAGAPGHGCGHNLLGVASLTAAIALKEALDKGEIQGTLRYYACPAEEMLSGKVRMAEQGVFDDLDACLAWHPSSVNMPWAGSLLSLCSAEFSFKGLSAHAGAAPHMGRSALDAVELMDIGANFMREHVHESSRIHYIITKGGKQPNTVPDEASVWYNLRAPGSEGLLDNCRWLTEIARGAAMMTQTTLLPIDFKSGVYEVLSNQTLVSLIEQNMRYCGPPVYSEADHKLAAKITASMPPAAKQKGMDAGFIPHRLKDLYLHEDILSPTDEGKSQSASTDAGDVSQIAPFAQFGACTWPIGVNPHTWQATASAGSGIGSTGMLFAAKTLACSLYDLFSMPEVLDKAKVEFFEVTGGARYVSVMERVKGLDG
jgi:aminobenzoyl-glutamate utilization protein B